MEGYTPGEQPKNISLIKLNTNENPYPPSPKVSEFLKNFNASNLRLYPNPTSDNLRNLIADKFHLSTDNVITGNGSDDILTITVRAFAGEYEEITCFNPSYSLYPVLAQIQNAKVINVNLNKDDFSFPLSLLDENSVLFKKIENSKLFFIARPNAPTGNNFPLEYIDKFCTIFKGIVFIDEAYADFSENNAVCLLNKHKNIIVSKTLSKSYSLAGVRLGWALADKDIISGLMKVKDSYNVNMLTQLIAIEAIKDENYFQENLIKIKRTREFLKNKLTELDFHVLPSHTNFLFTSPPNQDAESLYNFLRGKNILVRFFNYPLTNKYIRITIGTEEEINILIKYIVEYLNK